MPKREFLSNIFWMESLIRFTFDYRKAPKRAFFKKIQTREEKNGRPELYIDPEILVFVKMFEKQIVAYYGTRVVCPSVCLKEDFNHKQVHKEAEEKDIKKIYSFPEAFARSLFLMSRRCDDAQTNIKLYVDIEGVLHVLNIWRQKIETRLEFFISKVDMEHKNEKFCVIVF